MIKKFKYLIALCMLFVWSFGLSQSQDKIRIQSISVGDSVMLRWSFTDPEAWLLTKNYGLKIRRSVYVGAADTFSYQQRWNNALVLADSIKPFTSQQWSTYNFTYPERASAADSLLHHSEFVPVMDDPAFKNAIQFEKSLQNRHAFVELMANIDFEIAQGMALGLIDSDSLTNNYEYQYEFSFEMYGRTYVYTHNHKHTAGNLLPVQFLTGEGVNKGAFLQWNESLIKHQYIGYNVYKSEDQNTWTQINDAPVVKTVGAKTNETTLPDNVIYFSDSLAQNDTPYYYRLRGITAFGILGPWSDTVTVTGKPSRMDIQIQLQVDSETDSSVRLNWFGITEEDEANVDKFEIFMSANAETGYEKIIHDPIGPALREYTLTNLPIDAYVVIMMFDIHGHYYKSNSVLVQLKDSIPPATPVGISAIADKSGEIRINWVANTEQDLLGYRLYRSNGRGDSYVDVLGENINNNYYTDYLSNKELIDSVFYAVLATDYRGNYSPRSTPVGIARPDAVPPSDPVIVGVFPGREGVYFDWEPSPDRDVNYHQLQRRTRDEANWVDIVTFTPSQTEYYEKTVFPSGSYNYIDNFNLTRQEYEYRLIARDFSGNISGTTSFFVTPIINPIAGRFTRVWGNSNCYIDSTKFENLITLSGAISQIQQNPNNSDSITQSLMNLLLNNIITGQQYGTLMTQQGYQINQWLNDHMSGLAVPEGDLETCDNIIKWHYVPERSEAARNIAFEVYRAVNDYQFEFYKNLRYEDFTYLSDNQYEWKDEDVKKLKVYSYKLMAVHKDQTRSKMSEMMELKPY